MLDLVGHLRVVHHPLKVSEHDRLLKRDSRNSSLAPSNDPPLTRQQRRARERERAKREGRKQRGGQPGHEGKTRELAAPERVDDHVDHVPVSCGCGRRFDGSEERVGVPVFRQKWELPEVVALVIEHRLHRLLCPECGTAVLAEGDGVSASAFGPRLEAHVAVMAGVYRLSRRQIVEMLDEMFGTTVSVGAVDATIMRMSGVLADPWRELRDAVRHVQAVHADETSWRLRGETNWLWVAASALMACYRIDPSRSQAAAKELLGEDFGSFIITDRYAGYHWLDVLQQQLCWCHAIRQFVSLSERDGAPGRLGHELLAAAHQVIAAHREYLQNGHELTWLDAQLRPSRDTIETLLQRILAITASSLRAGADFETGRGDSYGVKSSPATLPEITRFSSKRARRRCAPAATPGLFASSRALIRRACSLA